MQSRSDILCVADVHAVLGEGPVWVALETALYWVDIKGRKIGGQRQAWALQVASAWGGGRVGRRCSSWYRSAGSAVHAVDAATGAVPVGRQCFRQRCPLRGRRACGQKQRPPLTTTGKGCRTGSKDKRPD